MGSIDNKNSFCKYLPSNSVKKSSSTNSSKSKRKDGIVPSKPFLITPSTSIEGTKRKSFSKKSITKYDKSTEWGENFSEINSHYTEKLDAKDYNIFHIDSKIREKLSSTISTIPELELDLKRTLWIWNHGDDPAQQVLAKHQASIIRRRIQDLESTLELTFYIFRTDDLLEEYRGLVKNSGQRSFVKINSKLQEENETRMKEIVNQYLCIAQNYIEIKNLSQLPKKITCSACNGKDFVLSPEDDSIYICKNCNNEQEILDDAPSFKDTDRVNMSSKYTYSRKGHFTDAKKRFQGTQNTDPKKIQIAADAVEKQMLQHNLVAQQGLPNSMSKDHVYLFLSEQNLSNHYEDLNLLFYIITGVPCPDISEYDELLDELFDKQEQALDKIKEDNRINSLNVNYKLYKLLQKVGYPCRKDDFHILKTPTKEEEHDFKMQIAWKMLGPGWDWIPTN